MRSTFGRSLAPLAVCLLAAAIAAPVAAQNLVLQWTFDDAAGGAVDAADTGLSPAADGVFVGGVTRSTDTPGADTGFSADLTAVGNGNYIVGGAPDKVDALTAFTMSTWVKLTGINSAQGGSNNIRLLSKQSNTPLFDGFSWNLNPPNDDDVDVLPEEVGQTRPDDFRMGMFIGGQNDFVLGFSDADVEDKGGEWVFLAVTYDGSANADNLKFYLGDETSAVTQLGSTLTADGGALFPTNGTPAEADFGVGFTDVVTRSDFDFSLPGFQDDVRVYDGVLDLAALDAVRLENLGDDPGLVGDANGDGKVDLVDLDILGQSFGNEVPPGTGADFNGDGVIDLVDLDILGQNFGAMAATATPEPTAAVLLAAGGLLGLARRR